MLGLANKEFGGHEVPCSQLVMWKHTMGSKVHDALFPKYDMADGSQVREPPASASSAAAAADLIRRVASTLPSAGALRHSRRHRDIT